MALARLALKNLLQQKVCASSSLQKQRWNNKELLKRFAATAPTGGGDKSEVAVTDEKKSNRLFRRRRGTRRSWLSSNHHRHFPPALYELFPSGLGNAVMQASEKINRDCQRAWSVKESDEHYKLRYEMPGIAKEDVNITIDDGVLSIKGEQKEEREDDDDDDVNWSSSLSYGYYNTSLVLPDDAKPDDIKAELKDGVLTLTIPRTHNNPKKDVKQVIVQ